MSAIVLTKTLKKNLQNLSGSSGFLRGAVLLYLSAFVLALLIPPALNMIPSLHLTLSPPWCLFLSLVIGILALWLTNKGFKRQFRQQIRVLTRTVKRYAKGDVNAPLPSWGDDSMDVLAGTIVQIVMNFQNKLARGEQEREKLSIILNHMQEGVIGVNGDRSILIHNSSAGSILGFTKDSLGKSLIEFSHNPEIDEAMRIAIAGQTSISKEIETSYPEKKILKMSAVGTGSETTGICGILVLHDITELKHLEKNRQEFVANASHELRTPLTSIKGFIETLLAGALNDPVQSEKFLKIMNEDANRLSRLIEDLLNLASIESKKIPLKITCFPVEEEIKKVLQTLESPIQKKKIKVSSDIKPMPLLYADRDRIHQVLLNLLDNAVKFNREAGTLFIRAAGEKENLEVTVTDTGIGIPENEIPRIFERFYRVDKARLRDEGGTGLGLSIVKHIIESHSGRISCESRQGQSTTFRFSIPLSGPASKS